MVFKDFGQKEKQEERKRQVLRYPLLSQGQPKGNRHISSLVKRHLHTISIYVNVGGRLKCYRR